MILFSDFRCLCIRWTIVLASVIAILNTVRADTPSQSPVRRRTVDGTSDLIDALIEQRRFDEARRVLNDADPIGDDPRRDVVVKALLRLAKIEMARAVSSGDANPGTVDRIHAEIVATLESYPDHPRRWFLSAAILEGRFESTRLAVILASLSPDRDEAPRPTLQRLVSLRGDLDAFLDRIVIARDGSDAIARDDLNQLIRRTAATWVRTHLIETELHSPGGPASIAAAAAAIEACDRTLGLLPGGSKPRALIERMRIEAFLMAGKPAEARASLERIGVAPPDRLWVETFLADADVDAAESMLERLSDSAENDLLRLRIRLAGGRVGEIGAWIDEIERRHGEFARRRAESISLRAMRRRGGGSVDTAVVVAQAEDLLRRGQPGRAADLLARVAKDAVDPADQIRIATRAAAAYRAAGRSIDAGEVLLEYGRVHPNAPESGAAHLQGIVLLAGTDQASTRVPPTLDEHLRLWDTGDTVAPAARWRLKIHDQTNSLVAAAALATRFAIEDEPALRERWDRAFEASIDRSGEALQGLVDDLGEGPASDIAWRLAVLFLDDVPPLDAREPSDSFFSTLAAVRRTGVVRTGSAPPPKGLVDLVRRRLIADGGRDRRVRRAFARWIESWPDRGANVDPVSEARLDHWRGESDAAVERLDRIAAGAAAGSSVWKKAKLTAMEILAETGRAEAARRRADYILLSQPPSDPAFANRLKEFTLAP